MKQLVTFFLSLLALISCITENKRFATLDGLDYAYVQDGVIRNVDKNDFPKELDIDSLTHIETDLIVSNKEAEVYCKGGYLIVKTLEHGAGEHLISILDTTTYRVVKKLARVGNGPDEFTDVRLLLSSDSDALCYLLNVNNEKLYRVSADFSMEYVATVSPRNVEDFRIGHSNIIMLDSVSLVIPQLTDFGQGRCKYSIQDSTVAGLFALNFTDDLGGFWALFEGNLAYNRRLNRIAYVMDSYDRIVFYNMDDDSIKIVQDGDPERVNVHTRAELFETGEAYVYYTGILSNDEYIFALYRGAKAYDPEFEEHGHYYIEQYTWDGTPVCRYKLPQGFVVYEGCRLESDNEFILVNKNDDDFMYKVSLPL